MFVDEAEIYIRGGDGGHGCVSFRRERCVPRGGPDGGTGGRGGSVYAVATLGVDTLLDFAGKHHWRAKNGRPGEGAQRAGHAGDDLVLELPHGTLIYDRDTEVLIKDLDTVDERTCIAAGGVGGRGNKTFATATCQTPREAETGEPGQERWLKLVLKLIADAGLVGLPNAGKSTLLSCLSKATPKVASYPFTTLKPQLGIVELSDYRRLVLADIPGLIEGAHEGAGLGDAFLRHIERTRVIVHLVDLMPGEGQPSPIEAYRVIRGELAKFSDTLAQKPELIVATKADLCPSDQEIQALRNELGSEILAISSVTRTGLSSLTERLWQVVANEKRTVAPAAVKADIPPPHLRLAT